jgi:hypothetical protein
MYTVNGLNYSFYISYFKKETNSVTHPQFGDAASPAGNLDVSTGMRISKGNHFFGFYFINDKYR